MKESRIAFGSVTEANGSCRIAAQLSAVIIFPCVVKCSASRAKGFRTQLLVI